MAIHWNAEAEARLLMGILAQMQRLDYKALAAFMGSGCSVPALKNHICKLRREAGVPAGSSGKPRTPSTRTPTKAGKAAADSPINQAKRQYHIVDDDDDDDDDDDGDKVIKDEKDVKPLIKDEYKDKKLKISFIDLA
ncbi:hypothetical protein ASPVEDRAFT_39932 [Aspergillus versicolor CBS 583.65]|uniref:Uncharacterized protein n=1 Tax=Aspergillus versicolor CBS 583.65 TaxID=1036611 RepID=A0A1L9PG10_ASPVE|nr:uncharacterized protein ASPVEDRAFT_39932 [Aspergillus versicolor CBS 583.65]OJJ00450.1 hypothetical protein ASPVEDRAFT_39932 [Aspergillus versicolor CBS 583.65]